MFLMHFQIAVLLIQHEFIAGERKILGRNDHQLTSAAGYAGGLKTDSEGRVCYHNFSGIADYGKLGHGEVVGMTIPQSSISEFAELYFSLYNPKTKGRKLELWLLLLRLLLMYVFFHENLRSTHEHSLTYIVVLILNYLRRPCRSHGSRW
jgi:hypothetical protein